MQHVLPIPLTDHHRLRCWQRLVALCAGGHTSWPDVVIVLFLFVHYLLVSLQLLLPLLLFGSYYALLRRCSCPSGLDECPMCRHTIRCGDEAPSLWKVCSRSLLLLHVFTVLSRGVYRLPQTGQACIAGIGASPGKYACSKGCVKKPEVADRSWVRLSS